MAGPTTQSPYRPVALRPAAGGVSHPAQKPRGNEPQSGGDRYGRVMLRRAGGPSTSGQAPTRGFRSSGAEESVKAPKLPRHAAYSNAADHLPYHRGKGNSEGRAEMLEDYHDGHITDTISRMAKNRLSKSFTTSERVKNENKAQGDEFTAKRFRREGPAFGPVRTDRMLRGRHDFGHDHHEGEKVHAKRLEGGSSKSHIRSTV